MLGKRFERWEKGWNYNWFSIIFGCPSEKEGFEPHGIFLYFDLKMELVTGIWTRLSLLGFILLATSVDEGDFVYSAAVSDWSLSPTEEYFTAWINLTYMDGGKLHTEKTEVRNEILSNFPFSSVKTPVLHLLYLCPIKPIEEVGFMQSETMGSSRARNPRLYELLFIITIYFFLHAFALICIDALA